MKNQRCFTLVELLTVIAIIAVLMGILLPVLAIAKNKARETQARTEIKSLALAIKQYEATYGFLPFISGDEDPLGGDKYITFIKCLQGDTTSNPRGLKWIEVQKDDTGQFRTDGYYKDPWKKDYYVSLDLDYDGDIEAGTGGPYEQVYGTMAIWSGGPDGDNDKGRFDKTKSTADNQVDDINGWDKAR